MDGIGDEVAANPELAEFVMEAPKVEFLGDPDDLGWSATMRGKVVADQRWAIGTEIRRRRLDRALLEQGVELDKRGVAPRVARGRGTALTYVPDQGETDE